MSQANHFLKRMPQDAFVPDPDDALVTRMVAGDRDAFEALFRRYHLSVRRFALQMTGLPDVADDVTQDVFMALAKGGDRYEVGHGALSTYLYGIARNLVAQRERRLRRRGEVNLDTLSPEQTPVSVVDLADHLAQRTRITALRRAILRLPPRYREVLVLCELHSVRYEDAATVIGCPVGTVRSRLSRARRLLADRCRASDKALLETGDWLRAFSGVTR